MVTETWTTDQSRLVEQYASQAYQAGCPRDQLENFLKAGLVLQPRQLAASSGARLADLPRGPREILYGGARAGGKSWWMVAQIGADDCQRQPGLKALLLRRVGKAVRESFEDLRAQVFKFLPHEYRKQDATLTFPNGSRIILGHFKEEKDIDAYLGLEYDVIGVEEATTLSFSKYQSIDTCCRTSKLTWRPRMYLTANPGGIGHTWCKSRFIEPFRSQAEADTRFIPATVDDNKFVNAGYANQLAKLTGWQLRAWRYGDWDIAAGQYFTTWSREHHVVGNFPIPAGWRVWGALDYGFTHYTTFYLIAQNLDGDLYMADEHAERRWLPERHVPEIKALLRRHRLEIQDLWAPSSPSFVQARDYEPVRVVAGADVFAQRGVQNKDGSQTIAENYKALGIPLSKADNDRVNGAAEILSRLGDPNHEAPERRIRPRLYVMERCARLIECIPALEHDPYHPEDVLKVDCDETGMGGDDPYDGARYGIMAAWKPPKKENRIIRPKDRTRYQFV